MIGSLNKIILIGEIDGEIEIKENSFEKKVAKFFLKTVSFWKDKEGFDRDSIERHRVVVFNERLISILERARHGTKISVEGSIQHSKWQDNNGNDHYTVEIVLSQYKGEIIILTHDTSSTIASINRVMLIGNLGADPIIRLSKSGKKIASITIATSDKYKKSNGEMREKTEWHEVVIFNEHLAQVVERYVKKGAKLYLEGYLRNKLWQDKLGNEHSGVEIVLSLINGDMTILSNPRGQNEDSSPKSEHSHSDEDFFEKEDDLPAF